MQYKNKVTIIGAGMVGSTTAYSLIANDLTEEIALIDINQAALRAQVMDLQHAVAFSSFTKVKMGTYDDIKDSRVVVVTAGAAQKPGESRLDLVKKNSAIMQKIVPEIFKKNKNIILLMITNPVDILTYLAIKMFPNNKNQIIGSGTVLDSARFRVALGQKLKVNPSNVHGYIVGEHGDSEVPLWSTVYVGNTTLDQFKKLSAAEKKRIFNSAKNAAYAIIKGKQSTYYAIASGATAIIRSILYDQQTVMPISRLMEGEYGIKDICLSLPTVLGRKGIVHRIKPGISKVEVKRLQASAGALKKVAQGL